MRFTLASLSLGVAALSLALAPVSAKPLPPALNGVYQGAAKSAKTHGFQQVAVTFAASENHQTVTGTFQITNGKSVSSFILHGTVSSSRAFKANLLQADTQILSATIKGTVNKTGTAIKGTYKVTGGSDHGTFQLTKTSE